MLFTLGRRRLSRFPFRVSADRLDRPLHPLPRRRVGRVHRKHGRRPARTDRCDRLTSRGLVGRSSGREETAHRLEGACGTTSEGAFLLVRPRLHASAWEEAAMRRVRCNPAMVVALISLFLASMGGVFAAGGALISGSRIKADSIPFALTPAAIRALRGKLDPQGRPASRARARPVQADRRHRCFSRCAARPDRRRHRRMPRRCGRARRRRSRQRGKAGVVSADRPGPTRRHREAGLRSP